MKTNKVKECVTDQLRTLQNLPEPQWRAELAELRRGVGRRPGELPALWGSLLANMPEDLRGNDEPSAAEWAVYLALTLFALHQQGTNRSDGMMNQEGKTLGGAVRQLAVSSVEPGQDWTESSVLRRFNALATADSMPEVSHYLRGMIQLLRREKIPLDYPQLAVDLYRLQFVESAANVRLQWGRQLYAITAKKTEENKKEN